MKKLFILFALLTSIGAHAIELPNISAKDRLRMELWSFGLDKVSSYSDLKAELSPTVRPELRPEILIPLENLLLEL